MAYFADLSFYQYGGGQEALNIGWLQRGYGFDTMIPAVDTLDLLWNFCSFKVMQARGGHFCDLCAVPEPVYVERNGVRLLLGTAEIRVFSAESNAQSLLRTLSAVESGGLLFLRKSFVPVSVYAAPTMIYHYVQAHYYKPPDEFLRALREGPKPPSREYFDLIKKLDLEE